MSKTRTKTLLLSLQAVLASPGPCWLGWLACPKDDKEELEKLGVVVGAYKDYEFEVGMSEEILEKLQPHWGRWIWGLVQYTEEEHA